MSLARIRLSYCQRCPSKCAPYRDGSIDLSDRKLACPIGRWKAAGSRKPEAGSGNAEGLSARSEAPPARFKLGDAVERLSKPIAKLLRLPCLQADGNLKPQSPCAKRRDALNRLTS